MISNEISPLYKFMSIQQPQGIVLLKVKILLFIVYKIYKNTNKNGSLLMIISLPRQTTDFKFPI